MATRQMKTLTIPELGNTYPFVLVDPSLQCAGDAADAKKTGERLAAIDAKLTCRVASLTGTPLAVGTAVECVGIPAYISDLTSETAIAYGLTDTGWYVLARISAPSGVTVGNETAVTGAKSIISSGTAYVDVAVRFEVAAASQAVTVTWATGNAETYVFKATDLAVRNLDYRTTFYVYDATPYVTWEYALTTDTKFSATKKYYTKSGDVYTLAEVTADADIPAETYYNHSKIIFQGLVRNVTYQLPETIDCPSEFILPEIEDETHGCWFEIRTRFDGTYSMTLTPPEGVKVATEHTQAEQAGINVIDLHYNSIGDLKIWRFLNTRSTIPTT